MVFTLLVILFSAVLFLNWYHSMVYKFKQIVNELLPFICLVILAIIFILFNKEIIYMIKEVQGFIW